jgi:hypothetical protein
VATQKVIYDQTGTAVRVLHADDRDATGWDSTFHIETVEDCEPIVDSVKALQDAGLGNGKNHKHVARVPLTVVEKAMREGWYNDEEAWRKWCNDPDNRDFRVWQGRV